MQLDELIAPLLKKRIVNARPVTVTGVTADSRRVQSGSLFIAIQGYTVDGHQFLADSVRKGAAALLVERPDERLDVPQIVVPNTRFASAVVASVFFDHPSKKLRMIGVTGTNGKTTVTHLIETILQSAHQRTGLYGTVGMRIDGVTEDVVNTTPEAVELQEILHRMWLAECQYGIMEVSSHALELGRVAGTQYHIAVFTNLTQDHLDFHHTMERYLEAKGKLFSRLGNSYSSHHGQQPFAVLNADDPASGYLARQTVAETVTYGIREPADVRAENVMVRADGVRFRLMTFAGNQDVQLKLTGRFNVYNALAATAAALIEGIDLPTVVRALENIPGIPGRLERVGENFPVHVLVDYSHTPDSLQNALQTIREFAECRILTVVGCGGDRDKGKRPIMAQIAAEYSDLAILTSDNPRTEDPEAILDDMVAGLGHDVEYQRISDRRQAIDYAVEAAQSGDVILIAGKGHETYQIVGRQRHHFDDREIALASLQRRFG